ncbi:hypothetical protein HYT56_02050 [Candidatus Woesearchaeota archaeon]|nr:hypothetical protein [Candidatus Woesearchaeota archaeon]
MRIKSVKARKIFDTQGKETIEIEINADDKIARNACDNESNKNRFSVNQHPRQGINYLIDLFNKRISNQLKGVGIEKFSDLKKIEDIFRVYDITENFEDIGGNIILATEYAVLRASLQEDISKLLDNETKKFPGIMFNIISGGENVIGRRNDIQEFLIIPKTKDFYECSRAAASFYEKTKNELIKRDQDFTLMKNFNSILNSGMINLEVLDMLSKIADEIEKESKIKIDLGVDIGGSSLWNGRNYEYKMFSKKNSKRNLSENEQIEFVKKLINNYNLTYVEDPFHNDDFDSFRELNKGFGVISGDDLISTRTERLKLGIKKISSVVINPSQVASLLKVKETIDFAFDNKIAPVFPSNSFKCSNELFSYLVLGWKIPRIKIQFNDIERINNLIRIKEKSF